MKSTGNSAVFQETRNRFRAHLRAGYSGPDFTRQAASLLAESAIVLKNTPHQRVLRGTGENSGLVFKFYSDRGLFARFRPSRARRALAAALTMRELGLPVVETLGYLESATAIAPFTSCLIMRFIPDAITFREWIKRNHRALAKEQWTAWRVKLRELWLDLERHGIYHDDTKALNILVQTPTTGAPRFCWIDPESVRPGHRPTKRQILRNLVQLNGSLRSWVPEEERLAFLREVAETHPWLQAPAIEEKIRRWTRERLLNEIRTRCGP